MNTPILKTNHPWILSFIAILFAFVTLQMSSLGFSPLLPDIKKAFDISYAQLGLFTGLYGLVTLVVSIPAGLLAKRFGEKRVLLSGMSMAVMGLVALSLAPVFAMALGSRVFWLIGYRLAFVCVMTAAVLTVPANRKGMAMGIVGATGALASVIGAPFGSHIGEAFGWRNGIFAYGVAALLGGCLFAIFYRAHSNAENIPAKIANDAHATPAYKTPIVWLLALLLGLANVAGFSATYFLPAVMKEQFHSSATDAAYVISSAYMLSIAGNFLVGYLVDRFDRWRVLGSAMLVVIPACFMLTINDVQVFQIAAAIVIATGHSVVNQVYGVAGTLLQGRNVGPAIGVVSLGPGVFGYVGPQMLGTLRDWTGGFNAGWYAGATAATLAFIIIISLKRYSDRSSTHA